MNTRRETKGYAFSRAVYEVQMVLQPNVLIARNRDEQIESPELELDSHSTVVFVYDLQAPHHDTHKIIRGELVDSASTPLIVRARRTRTIKHVQQS